LLNCSWPIEPLMFSGNTDCYQPLEKKLKITRSMLEVLVRYRYPVSIITKNSLITRDIDLLEDLAKDNLVNVMISITTLDDSLRQKLEPRTALAGKKLQTIKKLTDAGIPVGIMAAPIIPGLNDHEIPEIIKAASEAGASNAGYAVCRLNGAIGPLFQNWLTKNFPDKANKVWNQIASMHGGQVNDSEWHRRMRGTGPIAFAINQLFEKAKKMHMPNAGFSPLDLTKFRRGGNLQLF